MKPLIILLLAFLRTTTSQKAPRHEILERQLQNDTLRNPFLSTTLSAKITSVYDDDLVFDSTRKSIFSETLTHFLAKVFKDQQVYDVKIISVNLFDDRVLQNGKYEQVSQREKTKLPRGHQTLSFTTVVSAEYTQGDKYVPITNDRFRNMLIHVCDKFQNHLIESMEATGDTYFKDVESVVLGEFERIPGLIAGQEDVKNNSQVLGLSAETLNTASIVAIIVGGIVFFALSFASVKYYRKEKQLRTNGWIPNNIDSLAETATALHTRKNEVDDYSFNSSVPPFTNYKDDPVLNNPIINEEFSSVWPESSPSTLFLAPGAKAAAPPSSNKLSYTEELQKLPKQCVFAPPGKIGVAIDVVNGQPIVHKIRKNSPLENMLRPNDIIVAIDDEDASCLSAADVTTMMVKRMDRVRKISFVRHRG